MSITKISDHVAQAEARLTSAYANAAKAKALLGVFSSAVQDIEDALDEVTKTQLGKGGALQGASLDVLGRIIGLARMGLQDSTYAALLQAQIGINNSDGCTDTLLSVAAQLFQSEYIYISDPNAPTFSRDRGAATIQMAVSDPKVSEYLLVTLTKLLRKTACSGVSIDSFVRFSSKNAFACAGNQAWVAGCSDENGNNGGAIGSVIL